MRVRTRTRPTRLVAIALVMAVALAACGSDAKSDSSTKGSPAVKKTGKKIEVAAVWTGAEQKNFEAVLAAYTKQSGVDVSFTSTGDDIATVLGTRLEGGDPPDVAMLPGPGLMADLAGHKSLKPIEDIAGKLVDEHYAADWRTLGSVDDTLYGVWFKAANKSTVWYRTKAFDDAGIDVPKSWDDFVKASETLRDSGVAPVAVAGGDGWTLTDWFENVYLQTAGAEKYDQLTKHEIAWTDKSVVDTLTTLGKLWSQKDLIAPGADALTFPDSVTTVFGTKKAAMVYEGDFVAGNIESDTKAKLGTDADFFPFPLVDGAKPSVVGGGDVAVLLSDDPAAAELIKFLATPEAAEIWAAKGGLTSPNKDVDLSVYPNDVVRRSAEALVKADTFRFDLSDQVPAAFGGTPSQGMWKALQDFLADPSDPAATAKTLEALAAAAG